MIEIFIDNEVAYLEWIKKNLEGFVLNTYKKPLPRYAVLHKATCGNISKERDFGAYTERGYSKICSTNKDRLKDFTSALGRTDTPFSKECQRCNP